MSDAKSCRREEETENEDVRRVFGSVTISVLLIETTGCLIHGPGLHDVTPSPHLSLSFEAYWSHDGNTELNLAAVEVV